MRKALYLIPLVFGATNILADSIQYQTDISTSYQHSERNFADEYEWTHWRVQGDVTRYLTPLETAGAVQQELAFVRRASWVTAGVAYSRNEYERPGPQPYSHSTSSQTIPSISGQYFVSDQVFVRGSFLDFTDADADGLGVGVGYYYNENSAVQFDVTGFDEDPAFSLSTRSLVSLNESASLGYTLGISAASDAVSDTAHLNARTTYYFTTVTGVGVSGSYGIENSDASYRLFANHYFSDRVGFEVWVEDPDEDPVHFGASVTGRF